MEINALSTNLVLGIENNEMRQIQCKRLETHLVVIKKNKNKQGTPVLYTPSRQKTKDSQRYNI